MKKASIALLLLLSAIAAGAAPAPSGGSGTPGNGNTFTVTGSGFQTKVSPSDGSPKPYAIIDFEDGTQNAVAALSAGAGQSVSNQNMNVISATRGFSAKELNSDDVNWANFTPYQGIVCARFRMPSVGRGGKVYKFEKRKSAISAYSHAGHYENWKFDRFWANTSGGGYPNAYNAQNADSSASCTGGGGRPSPNLETGGSPSAVTKTSSNYRLPGSNWMAEERLIKFNGSAGATNGLYKIRQDGQLNIDRSDFQQDIAGNPAADLREWFTQDDPSNLGDCGGSTVAHEVSYDDLVYDYGTDAWARVMLGNASTLAACTIMEYQVATSWSAGSITFKQRHGELTSNTTKYIYVFDKDDAVNSNGFLLQAGVGNPPPVVTGTTPSTGTYNAPATTVFFTGTGFLSGGTVQIGTMTPVSAILTDSTSGRAVVPFGPPGATVDFQYSNTDGQSSVIPSTFTFSLVPGTPIERDPDPIRDDGKVFLIIIHVP